MITIAWILGGASFLVLALSALAGFCNLGERDL